MPEAAPTPPQGSVDMQAVITSLKPEYQEALANMPPEKREAVLAQLQGG